MHNIAIRYIFEKPNVSLVDLRVLEEGVEGWSKKKDLNASERWEVKRIVNALIASERGYFDRAKQTIARHNIHYRQLYKVGLPYIDVDNRTHFNKS